MHFYSWHIILQVLLPAASSMPVSIATIPAGLTAWLRTRPSASPAPHRNCCCFESLTWRAARASLPFLSFAAAPALGPNQGPRAMRAGLRPAAAPPGRCSVLLCSYTHRSLRSRTSSSVSASRSESTCERVELWLRPPLQARHQSSGCPPEWPKDGICTLQGHACSARHAPLGFLFLLTQSCF